MAKFVGSGAMKLTGKSIAGFVKDRPVPAALMAAGGIATASAVMNARRDGLGGGNMLVGAAGIGAMAYGARAGGLLTGMKRLTSSMGQNPSKAATVNPGIMYQPRVGKMPTSRTPAMKAAGTYIGPGGGVQTGRPISDAPRASMSKRVGRMASSAINAAHNARESAIIGLGGLRSRLGYGPARGSHARKSQYKEAYKAATGRNKTPLAGAPSYGGYWTRGNLEYNFGANTITGMYRKTRAAIRRAGRSYSANSMSARAAAERAAGL